MLHLSLFFLENLRLEEEGTIFLWKGGNRVFKSMSS